MKEIFNQIIERLQQHLSKNEFNIWLKDLEFQGFSDNKRIDLVTSSSFKVEKIKNSYLAILTRLFKEEGVEFEQIQLSVSQSQNSSVKKELVSISVRQGNSPSLPPSLGQTDSRPESTVKINENLLFDKFVVAGFNKTAHSFSKKVTEKLGAISPLYIYGNVGTGKTHLLHAIGNYYLQNFPFLKIACVNPNDFVAEFTKALSDKRDRQFRLKYRSLDVLLLDDIQFFAGKQKSCVEFFHVFNEVYEPGKQMVFCSDRMPEELEDMDDRLKSRLFSSAIVEIEPPNEAERAQILDHYALENGLSLSVQVKEYISKRLPPDIRKIIGVINTLVAYQDIEEKEITVEFCQNQLKQISVQKAQEEMSQETLLLAISNHAKIPLADFRSPKRTKTLAHYRQILMYLLRKHTTMSLPEIGRFLGGKTNSALLFGIRKIEKQLEKDPLLRQSIKTILARTQDF